MSPAGHRTVVALAFVAAACFSGYEDDAKRELRVRRGTFRADVVLTGELRAAAGEELAVPRLPQWQTSIKWIAADGADVRKGDRVVELDNSAFTSNLDAKRQAVAQAEQEQQQKEAEWTADTLQKELDVEKKRVDFEKAKLEAAVPKEIVSARDYQDRQIKLQRATVELAKATSLLKAQHASVGADRANLLLNLQKARRELQTAERAIEELILRAPRDGIVVLRDHPWEGRRLQEGDPVFIGLPLAQFPETSTLRAEAALPDVDDGKVAIGMPATVILDAYPSLVFDGRVSSISAVAQESGRQSLRRVFAVIVALDRIDAARMRPGLSARVVVHATARQNALLAPRAAIDFSAAKPRARLARGGTATVTLGPCNAQECVVADGVKEGEALRGPDA